MLMMSLGFVARKNIMHTRNQERAGNDSRMSQVVVAPPPGKDGIFRVAKTETGLSVL